MPFPQVIAVAASSPADLAGIGVGDQIVALNGVEPRDVIEYQLLADEGELEIELLSGGLQRLVAVEKAPGEPLGVEVASPVFDRVRTCDNHCAFCFIYQLPKGMRKSLYVKDDDYRLSFLYGNFTTLTRFTELDLARVVEERLSPLYVSIHATDPDVRAALLRNRRGATSLRWLAALLEEGIEVHGQLVVCPGVNDGDVLDDTLAGIFERFAGLASVAAVPLGVSRFSREVSMRPHSASEAARVVEIVETWQARFVDALGRRLAFAADEYYLLAGRELPAAEAYEGFPQEENGVGAAAHFRADFLAGGRPKGRRGGFFQSIDAAPAVGYRAPRVDASGATPPPSAPDAPVTVVTSEYGARILAPLLGAHAPEVEVLAVRNDYFGGNIAVAGLLTGQDLAHALGSAPADRRYLLPDVCCSEGRFLDGLRPEDLPRAVELVRTDGASLRRALGCAPAPALAGQP